LTYAKTMWVKTEFFSKQLVSSNIKLSVKIQTSFDDIQGQNLSLINGKQFQKVVWKTKLSYIISLSSYEKRTVYKSKSGWIYRNSMKWDFRNTVTYRMRNVMRNRWKYNLQEMIFLWDKCIFQYSIVPLYIKMSLL